jgi:hypothetical protein
VPAVPPRIELQCVTLVKAATFGEMHNPLC